MKKTPNLKKISRAKSVVTKVKRTPKAKITRPKKTSSAKVSKTTVESTPEIMNIAPIAEAAPVANDETKVDAQLDAEATHETNSVADTQNTIVANDSVAMTQSAPMPKSTEQHTCIWSILSIIFAFLIPLFGLIFGIIALAQIKKDRLLKGKGLATVGIIISSIFIIIGLLVFILFIGYFVTLFSFMNSMN